MTRTFRTCLFMFCLFSFFISFSLFWGIYLPDLSLSPLVEQTLLSIIMFILPSLLYFIVTNEPLKQTLRLHAIRPLHIVAAVLLGLSLQPFMSLLAYVSSFLFPNQVAESMQELTRGNLFSGLITIALLPAIFEEVCFRGIIFSGMKHQSVLKATLMTGFLFALMHLDPQQFLYTFVMGALFAYMVYRTNSLYSSIIAHFVFNGSQFLLAYFAELNVLHDPSIMLASLQEFIMTIFFLFIEMVFFSPLLFLGIWLLIKFPAAKEADPQDYHPSAVIRESLFNVPIVLTLLLYIIFGVMPYVLQFIFSFFNFPI